MRLQFVAAKPKKEPVYNEIVHEYVKNRIDRNKNFIGIFTGGTGSGKSFATIRFAFELSKIFDTPFTIDNNVAFDFKDLLRKIHDNKVNKPGYCYVFEEVGAVGSGGSSMEWQSQANAVFQSFLQTSRCLNQILLFNCPSFYDLSFKARKLCHFKWEADHIDIHRKVSYFLPFRLESKENKKLNKEKTYFFYLRYRTSNNLVKKFNKQMFRLPPKHLLEKYKEVKDDFVQEQIQGYLKDKESKKYDKIAAIIERMIRNHLGRDEILEMTGISRRYYYLINKNVQEKRMEEAKS